MNKTKRELLRVICVGSILLLSLAPFVFSPASAQSITEDTISAIAWSPNQDRLAVGRYNGKIEIKNASNGELLYVLTGHTEYIASLAWSPDGSKLSSASGDKTGRIWDATNGQLLWILTHPDTVADTVWYSDGSKVISGITSTNSPHNNLYIWNASTGQLLNQYSIVGYPYRVVTSAKSGQID